MSHKDEATAWFQCTIRGSRHELSDTSLVQFIVGLLSYYSECEAATKADILDSGLWIHKAAKQGLPEAQYELGEMFRHGVVCGVQMRFARKHQASRQPGPRRGHRAHEGAAQLRDVRRRRRDERVRTLSSS
jgi:hypothetical protein